MKNIIILFFTIIFLNCETKGENENINICIEVLEEIGDAWSKIG